ncbi:MerR family transcriptional regulator [Phragmitibacter flavus]|uniref:MerR family transcriptional regulator n=1 Tax=Phragmitibacter flavus TaxID=2576071 RepID=A0A5R8K9L4_9BACT|nr:MerR family transcriptional regulator [Phragmitibacter flavus]TLD68998.1 MerR family transcriptional regulator [Phragmitibacter flavus]
MPPNSKELRHPIKVVCHRTGLTSHAIRVWERRYGLICCQRTDSNRRLYSDDEIERLRLLKTLTDCGHRISQISKLDHEELYALHKKDLPQSAPEDPHSRIHSTPAQCLARCLEAVVELEAAAMTELLEQSLIRYGARTTLIQIVAPLVHEVGEAWRKGELRVVHEHLATNVVRDFLALSVRCYPNNRNSPEIVIATPTGQIHEVGALLAAAAARDLGWRATYLGPSLPAEEIAAAAATRKARAVALSTVYPGDDPQIPIEITRLRQLLPAETTMLIGGRAAFGYHGALRIPDVHLVTGLHDLEKILERIPSTAPAQPAPDQSTFA